MSCRGVATVVRRKVLWEAAGELRPLFDAVDTQFPVTLFWGPEFVLIYNAAYVPLIADKHPWALGAPARDVFPEAWAQIGPMMRRVRAGAGATWVEDEPVPLARLRDALDGAERADQVPALAVSALRSNPPDFAAVQIVPASTALDEAALRFPLGEDGRWVIAVPPARTLVGEALFVHFLRLVVSMIDRAMLRLGVREDEHAIAEALQRSLLSRPVEPDHVQVAVRYLPASRQAKVGGDWYDAFLGPDGELVLVVGDVTGHDQHAAAMMGRCRLRGVYYTLEGTPAAAMTAPTTRSPGWRSGTTRPRCWRASSRTSTTKRAACGRCAGPSHRPATTSCC